MFSIWIMSSLALACFLAWVGARLITKGHSLLTHCDDEEALLNSFQQDRHGSPACCRSLVHLLGPESRCECFRCRAERGERATEESQRQAEELQEKAAQRFAAHLDSH